MNRHSAMLFTALAGVLGASASPEAPPGAPKPRPVAQRPPKPQPVPSGTYTEARKARARKAQTARMLGKVKRKRARDAADFAASYGSHP